MKTQALIEALAQDAPLRSRFGRTLALAVAAGALLAVSMFFALTGFRPDIDTSMRSGRFLFKLAFAGALAVTATVVVERFARPGTTPRRRFWALASVPAALAAALVVEMAVTPSFTWAGRLVGHNALHCLSLIPLLSLGPLACLLYALRQGAPSRPGLAGALAGLVASGMAAMLYATNCTDDSPLFVATWYSLAIGIVALIGYWAGAKLLRW